MDLYDILRRSLEEPMTVTWGEAEAVRERWPACVLADIAALEDDTAGRERNMDLRRHISVCLGDSDALGRILGEDPADFANFYPEGRNSRPSTDQTIDAFLGKFNGGVSSTETAALEQMIFNPAPANYFQQSEPAASKEAETPQEQPQQTDTQTVAAKTESTDLTEGFAKLMIKNGNYTKALEILEELNLKNPKKSVYFADQIRFLRKLIINANKQ